MADERTYDYKGVLLNYRESGTGAETMLAFHGFGQKPDVFDGLANAWSQKYRIFSFGLFYHGSTWPFGDQPLTPEFLSEMIESFLSLRQVNEFSVIAYSIGVRMALAIAEKQPERIKNLFLIAPDGIKINFWYRLATGSWLTQKIFRHSVRHPEFLVSLAKWAGKLRLIHQSTSRFAVTQVGFMDKREKVYNTWMVMRKLKTRLKPLARVINNSKMQVKIFLGKKDRIITDAHVKPLADLVPGCEIIHLPSDHRHLIDGFCQWLLEIQVSD